MPQTLTPEQTAASSTASPETTQTTQGAETVAETTSAQPTENQEQATQTDAKTTAATSTADEHQDAKPASLLDVVRDVVDPKQTPEPSTEEKIDTAHTDTATSQATDAKKDEAKETEGKTEPETEANVPFHNHPRWKALLAERDSLKGDAHEYGLIQHFMSEHNLTAQEVAQGYQIMALLKNDPLKARAALAPILDNLNQFSGETLPSDLKQKVDEGLIAEDMAKEVARQRAEVHLALSRLQTEREAQQRQQELAQTQAVQERRASIGQAVLDWENSVKSRDADYQIKQQFVVDKVRSLMASEQPQTSADAVALAQRAYDEVTKSLSAMLPRKAPAKVATSDTSSASTVQAQPRNLREVVAFAASKAG